jgi:antitoxin VapB
VFLTGERQELVHAIDGVRRQFLKRSFEPRVGLDTVKASRPDEGIHRCRRTRTSWRTREHPVRPSEGNGPDLALKRIVVWQRLATGRRSLYIGHAPPNVATHTNGVYAEEGIMTKTTEDRHVRLFRNGRNQAIRIPRDLELPGEEAVIRREGARLIIEPVKTVPLRELLAQWAPLDESWPDIESLPAEPVDF